MRRISLIIFLFIWHSCLYAQEDFFSRLPIVIINTDIDAVTGQPAPITDEPKVGASMKIIYVNEETGNWLSDSTNPDRLQYDGRIAIEIRGSTSQLTEKKSYGFETRLADGVSNNNVSLLGMPKEHDWILNGFYYEDSYLRDPLTYTLGRRTGHYAPRTHYCELFLNGTYQGLYLFSEKIKREGNELTLHLTPTHDIAANLGKMKTPQQRIVAFALETNNEQVNAQRKLEKKNADFIVLNSTRIPGTTFRSDENQISIISSNGKKDYEKKPKSLVARDIIDELAAIL